MVVPTSTVAVASGSVVNSLFDNLTASNCVSTVAYWDEFDPWFFRYATQHFGPILNFLDIAGVSFPSPPFIKDLVKITVILGLSVTLIGVGVVVLNFWRHLRTADNEVMGFTNAVRSKRASLMQRMDLVIYTIDEQLDQITKNVIMQQERVHEELASFRPDGIIGQEVNMFREALKLHVQDEFDRQVSQMKDFLLELEHARHAIPDPAKVRARCEELQDLFRQAKESKRLVKANRDRLQFLHSKTERGTARCPACGCTD